MLPANKDAQMLKGRPAALMTPLFSTASFGAAVLRMTCEYHSPVAGSRERLHRKKSPWLERIRRKWLERIRRFSFHTKISMSFSGMPMNKIDSFRRRAFSRLISFAEVPG